MTAGGCPRRNQLPGVRDRSDESNRLVQVRLRDLALEILKAAEICASDNGLHGDFLAHPLDNLDEAIKPLLLRKAANAHHEDHVISNAEPRAPRRAPDCDLIDRWWFDAVRNVNRLGTRGFSQRDLVVGFLGVAHGERYRRKARPGPSWPEASGQISEQSVPEGADAPNVHAQKGQAERVRVGRPREEVPGALSCTGRTKLAHLREPAPVRSCTGMPSERICSSQNPSSPDT